LRFRDVGGSVLCSGYRFCWFDILFGGGGRFGNIDRLKRRQSGFF